MTCVLHALSLERSGDAAASLFGALQSHAADLEPRSATRWSTAAKELLAALEAAGWRDLVEKINEHDVVEAASRVTSNNFALHVLRAPNRGKQSDAQDSAEGIAADKSRRTEASLSALEESEVGDADKDADKLERRLAAGCAVYLAASFFNHSCDANCEVERGHKCATVRAIRDVAVSVLPF
jgi:hypothetical protein